MLKGTLTLNETQMHQLKTMHIDPYIDIIYDALIGSVDAKSAQLKSLVGLVMQDNKEYDKSQRAQAIEEDAGINDFFLYSQVDLLLPDSDEKPDSDENVDKQAIYKALFKLLHEIRWNKVPGSKSDEQLNRYTSNVARSASELYQNYQTVTDSIAKRLSQLGVPLNAAMVEAAFMTLIQTSLDEYLAKIKATSAKDEEDACPSKTQEKIPQIQKPDAKASSSSSSSASASDDRKAAPLTQEKEVKATPEVTRESKKRKKPSEDDETPQDVIDPFLEQLREHDVETMTDAALAAFLNTYTPAHTASKKTPDVPTQEELDCMLAIRLQEEEQLKASQHGVKSSLQ